METKFDLRELYGKVTDVMKQYIDVKVKNPDSILFYRIGDFYEMFFDDAILASRVLDLTLTGKDCGMKDRAPMCGIPYHAAEKYISSLIEQGYKVAICEQVEDPKTAKGLVKRDIIRIVTPGTIIEQEMLQDDKNNYILSVYKKDNKLGLAYADISTGEFYVKELSSKELDVALKNELAAINPKEILYNSDDAADESFKPILAVCKNYFVTPYYDWCFVYKNAYSKLINHFKVQNLNAFDIEGKNAVITAAGALLEYVNETQKGTVLQITSIKFKHSQDYMYIDTFTRRNLELTENIRTKKKYGSLLGLVDKTRTAAGARMLYRWFTEPLMQYFDIERRLDAVEEFFKDRTLAEELSELLFEVKDIERITSKITAGSANARELVSLRDSLREIPKIKTLLSGSKTRAIIETLEELDELSDVETLISNTISDNPPLAIKDGDAESHTVRDGYSEVLDNLWSIRTNGAQMILEMEASERERTQIKTLKISYNRVFGYYIDITNSFKDQVPDDYIRRQTLANSERYVTPKLKEFEDTMLNSETKILNMETEIFRMIRSEIADERVRLQKTSNALSTIDCLLSLANVAYDNDFVRPELNQNGIIDIKEGRHPVIESNITRGTFVPNDTYLDMNDNKVMIITGPNMAGKSTFMRQVALISFLMQVGSFVPARSANLCVVDRIFTRAGATDDISQGQSTFMVEMNEVASILHNATEKSLLIFDEIGRGTSTYDGLSIAWAVVEHVADIHQLGAKTLFATHYHELTELENKLTGVKNYHVVTKEFNDDIVFVRKIVPGEALHSYGIQVAKLAGVPDNVISRAKEILKELESSDINKNINAANESKNYIPSGDEEKALKLQDELKRMNVDKITAIEALVLLDDLKKRYT